MPRPPEAAAPHVTSRVPPSSGSSGSATVWHWWAPAIQGLASVRRSGLRAIDSGHVLQSNFVVLVLHDEDGIRYDPDVHPVPRVPLRLLMDCTICSIIKNALPVRLYFGVIVRVRGCRWSTPMRWCRGRGPSLCSWIAVRSCGWSVTQHETVSTLTLCSAFSSADVWAPSILASHGVLGVMLRSVEASSEASEAIRTGSPSGRLSLQPASVYSGVSGTASCCSRPQAGGPGRHHSPVRAGSVRLCQPSAPGLPSLVEGLT